MFALRIFFIIYIIEKFYKLIFMPAPKGGAFDNFCFPELTSPF